VQNAYIESFNSRLRDECLSQHWFASLSHMRSVVDTWRDDYNHRLAHRDPNTFPHLPDSFDVSRVESNARPFPQTPAYVPLIIS
jgi:hypothetical protein